MKFPTLLKSVATLAVAGLIVGQAALAQNSAAPAPFNGKKQIHIAMVRNLIEGEFMEMYRAGAERQAALMGIKLTILGKHGDNAAQANFMYQAINLGVDGIIVQHGLTETMAKPAADAVAKGIPVVAFDVDLKNPAINQIAQDDFLLGRMAVEQLIKDVHGKADVGYIYVAGILPLDKRDSAYAELKKMNPGINEVSRSGTLDSPIAVKNADQVKAVLRAKPTISAYLAPYDEFAKGVVMALDETSKSDKVKIYSADISTQDIQMMIKPGSPWAATAATNPAAIGAVSVRAIAKKIAGEALPKDILIEPMLFTQTMLRDSGVTTMTQLRAKFPQFDKVNAATAPWIKMD